MLQPARLKCYFSASCCDLGGANASVRTPSCPGRAASICAGVRGHQSTVWTVVRPKPVWISVWLQANMCLTTTTSSRRASQSMSAFLCQRLCFAKRRLAPVKRRAVVCGLKSSLFWLFFFYFFFWPAAVAFFVPLLSKMEAKRGSAAKTSPVRAPAILLHCSCNVMQSREDGIQSKETSAPSTQPTLSYLTK